MITCSKIYKDIPFAHRQHNHDGHCSMIHGHNWTFKFTFAARELDENGFVIDFGKLGWLKDWINILFDHKLVLNADDPHIDFLTLALDPHKQPHTKTQPKTFASITRVPNCGAEGIAMYLLQMVDELLERQTKDRNQGRVYCVKVKVSEDSKNSATATRDAFDSNE